VIKGLLRLATLLLLVVAPLLGTALVAVPPASAGVAPATATFQRTWARTDQPVATLAVNRTWMWGPDGNTAAMTETYAQAPGGTRTVQYFDKSRMEDNSYRAMAPWDVTNGLLVVELVTGNMQVGDSSFQARGSAQVNVAGDADDPTGPTYATFAGLLGSQPYAPGAAVNRRVNRAGQVTVDPGLNAQGVTAAYYVDVPGIKHQVASPFWGFMNSSGLVDENGVHTTAALFENPFYATGYPITEAYWANVKVGGNYRDVLMQCFERRCLTYTPSNPSGWMVEAGNVGQHYYTWRYGAPPMTAAPLLWTQTAGYLTGSTATNWETVPAMQTAINLAANADLAISYSAEIGGSGGRMFVRAAVDGQAASPSDVVFAIPTTNVGARSFTFVKTGVAAGPHTVTVQWLADSGFEISVAYRTMSVSASPQSTDRGALAVRAAPSGPPVTTTSAPWAWQAIPDMSTTVTTGGNSNLAITLSGEVFTDGGWMYVRALVDGQPADPSGDEPIYSWGGFAGTHSFTWTKQQVAAGNHSIVMQWVVDSGTTGSLGDRTLVISASPPNSSTHGGVAVHARAYDAVNTTAQSWVSVPDMTASLVTPADATLAITFSGEGYTSTDGERMIVRALVDGQPADPPEAYFIVDTRFESRSFTFAVQHLGVGTHTVVIQWQVYGGGTLFLEDRTLTVLGPPVP